MVPVTQLPSLESHLIVKSISVLHLAVIVQGHVTISWGLNDLRVRYFD